MVCVCGHPSLVVERTLAGRGGARMAQAVEVVHHHPCSRGGVCAGGREVGSDGLDGWREERICAVRGASAVRWRRQSWWHSANRTEGAQSIPGRVEGAPTDVLEMEDMAKYLEGDANGPEDSRVAALVRMFFQNPRVVRLVDELELVLRREGRAANERRPGFWRRELAWQCVGGCGVEHGGRRGRRRARRVCVDARAPIKRYRGAS